MNRFGSALFLILLAIVGGLFFWLTDPTLGIASHVMDASINRIDAANQSFIGTLIGLAGSGLALLIGLWSILRRAA